ncbi:rhodanese domain-containing protein [Marinobacter santoriniensis NKSG1]|uniref:Rhodanese domain-containing protein n=1 Tax=Marinobacter santoriniensis NKSG1 TaxID=1288826 RepID=M7CMM9_9GAMM|nr:sulfurtransferase [Marinobacter santoriniensis]EMP54891.1 rhodanese domain-containing protein [Marinobacter santoriniensis NKSG1]
MKGECLCGNVKFDIEGEIRNLYHCHSPLVSTDWLQDNLANDRLVLIDASMVNVIGREPIVYDAPVFIPGSYRIDLEGTLCDTESPQVHAFPTEAQFTAEARRLGITPESLVVLYDNQGIYSAPRAWWILRAMGLKQVFVLDGGLPQWLAEGRDTVSTPVAEAATPGTEVGKLDRSLVRDSGYVFEHLEDEDVTVIDARSQARFLAQAPEPRPGVRGGHIPNSLNLPFAEVLEGYRFKPASQLADTFAHLAPSLHPGSGQQLVFSCGSGITACIILLAAELAGYSRLSLYDGSWADWGSNEALPVT